MLKVAKIKNCTKNSALIFPVNERNWVMFITGFPDIKARQDSFNNV